jgi:hypothetical protein
LLSRYLRRLANRPEKELRVNVADGLLQDARRTSQALLDLTSTVHDLSRRSVFENDGGSRLVFMGRSRLTHRLPDVILASPD